MKKNKTKRVKTYDSLKNSLLDQYKRGESSMQTIWDEAKDKERIVFSSTYKKKKTNNKSKVNDPRVSTLIFERAARVMAQNPTGVVKAYTEKNKTISFLLNSILKNYTIPNANSQFDFLTKTRIWDVYSNIYGSMGVLVDWVVKDDYIGPDFSLIPFRNLILQPGIYQIHDMDWVMVRTYVSGKWLTSRSRDTWKNIDELIEKSYNDVREDRSWIEDKYHGDEQAAARDDDSKIFEIVTRYEKDRWVTFSPKTNLILRDMKNPNKNGRIPVVLKHCFPLLDRAIGLGEVERTGTLQRAVNSLINLYLAGVEMSIFPPVMVNPDGVYLKTLKYGAAQKWLVKQPNSISPYPISPQGTNTFQQTYAFLNAAILNAFGTTNTAVTSQTDPGMGKTPQALQMLQMREAARDNWDRFMMEKALEEVLDYMVDMLTHRQEKPIKMYLGKEDLEKMKEINPDLVKMFESGDFGQAIVNPKDFKETTVQFFIDSGSTMKKEEIIENQNILANIKMVLELPGADQQIAQTGKVKVGDVVINVGELIKRSIITSGMTGWDKVIESEEQQQNGNMLNFENPFLREALQTLSPEMQQELGVNQPNYGQTQTVGQPSSPIPPNNQVVEESGGRTSY